MSDVASLFRQYASLDLMRLDRGLTVSEHEEWSKLKVRLDQKFERMKGSPSRRSAERVGTKLNCSFSSSVESRDAVVINLSTGGVFIRTDWPLPIDSTVRLQIRLEEVDSEIDTVGVVVSNNVEVSQGTTLPGMGVRFIRPDAEVVDRISELYSAEYVRASKALTPFRREG